mmetsp:Transcript_117781/g.333873  ORF Transcript_117781/g.333873 Transcript_117781/m.333873 type:complete len:215 (+) Transcript_117781:789-1433(+)
MRNLSDRTENSCRAPPLAAVDWAASTHPSGTATPLPRAMSAMTWLAAASSPLLRSQRGDSATTQEACANRSGLSPVMIVSDLQSGTRYARRASETLPSTKKPCCPMPSTPCHEVPMTSDASTYAMIPNPPMPTPARHRNAAYSLQLGASAQRKHARLATTPARKCALRLPNLSATEPNNDVPIPNPTKNTELSSPAVSIMPRSHFSPQARFHSP